MRDYASGLLHAEEKVEEMNVVAYEDPLTHVGNKAAYDNMSLTMNEDILSHKVMFALVMIDQNYLKKVNDECGHDRGNEYIIGACHMIRQVYGNSPIFRIGGDEFVVVLKGRDYRNRSELFGILKREFSESAERADVNPWERISAACGMSVFMPDEDSSVEEVFKRADEAMYADKEEMHAGRE